MFGDATSCLANFFFIKNKFVKIVINLFYKFQTHQNKFVKIVFVLSRRVSGSFFDYAVVVDAVVVVAAVLQSMLSVRSFRHPSCCCCRCCCRCACRSNRAVRLLLMLLSLLLYHTWYYIIGLKCACAKWTQHPFWPYWMCRRPQGLRRDGL